MFENKWSSTGACRDERHRLYQRNGRMIWHSLRPNKQLVVTRRQSNGFGPRGHGHDWVLDAVVDDTVLELHEGMAVHLPSCSSLDGTSNALVIRLASDCDAWENNTGGVRIAVYTGAVALFILICRDDNELDTRVIHVVLIF